MQSIAGSVAFDGQDPRFPNLERFPLQAKHFSEAVAVARRYNFSLAGIEHLILVLLGEQGFRSLIESAGGDADACRGALAKSFRDHASYMPGPLDVRLAEGMHALIHEMDAVEQSGPNVDPDVKLADFYLNVIRSVRGSMLAECALQDSGAGSLLLNIDDLDFYDAECEYSQSHRDTQAITDSMFDVNALLSDNWPEENPPASHMVSRRPIPGGRAPDAGAQPDPAARKSVSKGSPDAAGKVDACLLDLGAKASRGEIDPVVGRDNEIDRILSVLRRRRKSSVILYGEAGVGKTAIAEGLALRLRSSLVERELSDRPFYELSLSELVAGTKYRGDFEDRMTALVNRMREERAIVFVDEFHMIVGSGTTNGREMDGANMLKTALGRGEITVIGATTPTEMRGLRQDAAFMRRFEPISIREPSRDETLEILSGAAWSYLEHHDVEDTPGVLAEICRLTDLYQPERRFPDKAFDLLDAACVTAREHALRKAQGAPLVLTKQHVGEAADKLGLRRPRLPTESQMRRFAALEGVLSAAMPDQASAIRELTLEARAAALNLEPAGPVTSILLSSPSSGCAQRLAHALSEALDLPFRRIDLGQMRDRLSLHQLVGLAGASGPEKSGRLVEIGDSDRDMVLFLDGVEKAESSIQEFIAEVLRAGTFRAADGRQISLRGAWVILACTSGQKGNGQPMGFGRVADADADIDGLLEPELLTQVKRVIRLAVPVNEDLVNLAATEVAALSMHFRDMGVALSVDHAALQLISSLGSAASVRAEVQGQLRDLASAAIWAGNLRDGIRIGVDETGKVLVTK